MVEYKGRQVTVLELENQEFSRHWVPELHHLASSTDNALKKYISAQPAIPDQEFGPHPRTLENTEAAEKAKAVRILKRFYQRCDDFVSRGESPLLACFFESNRNACKTTKDLYYAIETLGFGLPPSVAIDEAKCLQTDLPLANNPELLEDKQRHWLLRKMRALKSGASLIWELFWNKSRLSRTTLVPSPVVQGTFTIPVRKPTKWLERFFIVVAVLFAVGIFFTPGALVNWWGLASLAGTWAVERYLNNSGRLTRAFVFFENLHIPSKKKIGFWGWEIEVPTSFPRLLYPTYPKWIGFCWMLVRGVFFGCILYLLYYQNSSYANLLKGLQAGPWFFQVALSSFPIAGVTLTLSWVLANIIFGFTVFFTAALIYDCCSQLMGWGRNIPFSGSPLVLPYSASAALGKLREPEQVLRQTLTPPPTAALDISDLPGSFSISNTFLPLASPPVSVPIPAPSPSPTAFSEEDISVIVAAPHAGANLS